MGIKCKPQFRWKSKTFLIFFTPVKFDDFDGKRRRFFLVTAGRLSTIFSFKMTEIRRHLELGRQEVSIPYRILHPWTMMGISDFRKRIRMREYSVSIVILTLKTMWMYVPSLRMKIKLWMHLKSPNSISFAQNVASQR